MTAITEPNPYQLGILFALNHTGKHVYAGTASPKKVAATRRRNKLARASRKGNRR